MDLATIIGMLAGFGLIITAIFTGGGAGMFLNVPSMLIVVGGMISATLIHFSVGRVLKIVALARKTLFNQLKDEQAVVQRLVDYAAISRRDGVLALEQPLAQVDDPFTVKALQMVIDGQNEEAIQEQLAIEVHYLQARHQDGKKILEFMGGSAPAFGMIGTLIGLIQMLRNLDDVSSIGTGMATALITTFYGALMANLVFLPLAGKLALRSKKETLQKEMMTEGVVAIARGESPTAVRERMQGYLSAKQRQEVKPNV